ncbi:MAG: 50S ribosomal protein L32 [Candidatus Omnitrophica bacterium]|nr:50S ribosomal protein L32 [Candidatus Omnitrophota bacterium]
MANPRKKHTSARQAKRRTHWKIRLNTLATCSHCKKRRPPHRICPHCGYYKGKPVVVIKVKEKKKKGQK